MALSLRTILFSAIVIFALYWGLVLVMNSFGVDLPDPIKLLPASWR